MNRKRSVYRIESRLHDVEKLHDVIDHAVAEALAEVQEVKAAFGLVPAQQELPGLDPDAAASAAPEDPLGRPVTILGQDGRVIGHRRRLPAAVVAAVAGIRAAIEDAGLTEPERAPILEALGALKTALGLPLESDEKPETDAKETR